MWGTTERDMKEGAKEGAQEGETKGTRDEGQELEVTVLFIQLLPNRAKVWTWGKFLLKPVWCVTYRLSMSSVVLH